MTLTHLGRRDVYLSGNWEKLRKDRIKTATVFGVWQNPLFIQFQVSIKFISNQGALITNHKARTNKWKTPNKPQEVTQFELCSGVAAKSKCKKKKKIFSVKKTWTLKWLQSLLERPRQKKYTNTYRVCRSVHDGYQLYGPCKVTRDLT